MKAIVTFVTSVDPVGETLSVVSINGIENQVVANRKEDGSFRWEPKEVCVYVPENAIVPEDVLKERGYWEADAKKGLLGGSKGNRVKGRTFAKTDDFAGYESKGLLFKIVSEVRDGVGVVGHWIERGSETQMVRIGDDVSEFLGITEYVA